MEKYIAVLGTGGTGSNIGADLIREGHNVVLIDQWPAHVEAMKTNGLRIIMPGPGNDHDNPVEFQVPVPALHLCEVCTLKRQLDIVFLACKSYDTRWMVELIKPYLKSDGVLVSAQNSLNDEWIAPMIGYHRDIACAFELSSEVLEPGVVKRNNDRTTTRFLVGELHGRITPRVREIARILSAAGIAEGSTNIWGAKWTKLVINTMTQPLSTIAGIREWDVTQNPKYLGFAIRLARETIEVSKAWGVVLEPLLGLTAEEINSPTDEDIKRLYLNLAHDIGKEIRNALQQDITIGRPTEVDYLSGLVVKKGREVNVPAPLNEAVVSLVKQIVAGKLKPSVSTLEMLDQQALKQTR